MMIKSILCAYSGEGARQSGLRQAIMLARHHGARITGALEHARPLIERLSLAKVPDALLEHVRQADAARSSRIRARFDAAMAEAGLTEGSEFLEIDAVEHGPLSEMARWFDLTVTGPHSTGADEEHLSANPDLIALQSGRPVLVVPDGYQADGLAERAIVAWDGKRAAARALADATPILAEKAHVTLLTIGSATRGSEILLRNLQRSGLKVDARTVERRGGVARTILDEAEADGSRLIVMGAFEHSKFSHDLFGGVTTDVIRSATTPVFMAH